jgi:hypothetical protein
MRSVTGTLRVPFLTERLSAKIDRFDVAIGRLSLHNSVRTIEHPSAPSLPSSACAAAPKRPPTRRRGRRLRTTSHPAQMTYPERSRSQARVWHHLVSPQAAGSIAPTSCSLGHPIPGCVFPVRLSGRLCLSCRGAWTADVLDLASTRGSAGNPRSHNLPALSARCSRQTTCRPPSQSR